MFHSQACRAIFKGMRFYEFKPPQNGGKIFSLYKVCKASLLDVRNNYYKMQENNLAAPLCSLTSLAGGEGLAVPPKEPNPIFGPLSQA